MLNIVLLNGGRGAATLIPTLLNQPGVKVTSIVNAYDDGRSTGEIRRFFDMLGPSDLRKVQGLMLPEHDAGSANTRALFEHRFPEGVSRATVLADFAAFCGGDPALAGIQPINPRIAQALRSFLRYFLAALPVNETMIGREFNFSDCALMNCVYAGAFLANGRDMEATTLTIDRLFRLRGVVLPNSGDNRWLVAQRENGEILKCEADIVELRSNERIARLFLLERPLDTIRFAALSLADQHRYLDTHHSPVRASAGVRLAIEQADIVIYCAGTQHSSLFPTYMSHGIAAAIAGNATALKIFVTNIGADYETPQYRASDFLAGALHFLRLSDAHRYATEDLFSLILVNNSRIKADETYVEYDEEKFRQFDVERLVDDLESREAPGKHDGQRVVETILNCFERADQRRIHDDRS